jgi:hypothetical protein
LLCGVFSKESDLQNPSSNYDESNPPSLFYLKQEYHSFCQKRRNWIETARTQIENSSKLTAGNSRAILILQLLKWWRKNIPHRNYQVQHYSRQLVQLLSLPESNSNDNNNTVVNSPSISFSLSEIAKKFLHNSHSLKENFEEMAARLELCEQLLLDACSSSLSKINRGETDTSNINNNNNLPQQKIEYQQALNLLQSLAGLIDESVPLFHSAQQSLALSFEENLTNIVTPSSCVTTNTQGNLHHASHNNLFTMENSLTQNIQELVISSPLAVNVAGGIFEGYSGVEETIESEEELEYSSEDYSSDEANQHSTQFQKHVTATSIGNRESMIPSMGSSSSFLGPETGGGVVYKRNKRPVRRSVIPRKEVIREVHENVSPMEKVILLQELQRVLKQRNTNS